MSRDFSVIAQLPESPAVYALYGGRKQTYVAYVGVAKRLRARAKQHFVRRDSSVTTGASTVALDPDRVCQLAWWEDERFARRHVLEAAELVACDVLDPTLRSRGGVLAESEALAADDEFRTEVMERLTNSPTGRMHFPSLEDAFARIAELEMDVADLKRRLADENSDATDLSLGSGSRTD